MNKAVVTGALGFIGFHLCQRLLEEGIEVTAIDSLDRSGEKEERLDMFGRNALFTWVDPRSGGNELQEAFERCDVCFQLWALPPAELQKGGGQGCFAETVTAAGRFPSSKLPFLVFVSSTEVYGSQSGEVKETAATEPTTSRGTMNLASEAFLENTDFPLAVLRICEVYGPLQSTKGSIHQLIEGGSPQQDVDDLVYIDDAIAAAYAAANVSVSGIFNIASGKPGQWDEAKTYILGDNYENNQSSEDQMWYSIEKARKLFGYEPKIPIKEGIHKQMASMNKG